jgi:hypothetical protein
MSSDPPPPSPSKSKISSCPICRGPIETNEKLARCPCCTQLFHYEHFAEWVRQKGTCPTCREEIKDKYPIEPIPLVGAHDVDTDPHNQIFDPSPPISPDEEWSSQTTYRGAVISVTEVAILMALEELVDSVIPHVAAISWDALRKQDSSSTLSTTIQSLFAIFRKLNSSFAPFKVSESPLTLFGITEAPPSISDFGKLGFHSSDGHIDGLGICSKGLATIPKAVLELKSLQKLWLYDNSLQTLPGWLDQLTNLQELNLGANNLYELPESLPKWQNLQKLKLSHNQLINLPDWLGNLKTLQELMLGSNPLLTIPVSLSQLTNLKILDLHNCQLTTVPEWLRKLSNLGYLDLQANQLSVIPEWLGKLKGLQYLNLDETSIGTLPGSLVRLKNLKWLDVYSLELSLSKENQKTLRRLAKRGCRINMPFDRLRLFLS